MAEKEQKENKKQKQEKEKAEKQEKKKPLEEETNEVLVRILGYDIPGSRNIHAGLIRIKGISWAISNVVCLRLGLPKLKKISELTKPEILKIETFLKDLKVPDFMKNARSDPETGLSKHLFGADLEMKREFDIKKLKEMKSYKGIRHSQKLPVRGQRTRSHFRQKGKATGIKKKDDKKK